MQIKDLKTKAKAAVKFYAPEIASAAVLFGVTTVVYFLKSRPAGDNKIEPFIDADGKVSYSNGLHIVLENVEKDVWRDMDHREDQYRLVPHAVVWEDAQ